MSAPELNLPVSLLADTGRAARSRRWLTQRLSDRTPMVMPGVSDPLGARLVERAGFETSYITGAGIANVQYGIPDIGLLGLDEIATVVRRVSDTVSIPLIVDADTGYGAPLSVMRTVHTLEAAGASAIQLEDQAMPKKCGHFDQHSLIDSREMSAKIASAVAARADDNLVIIARTDALGVLGVDEALRRGHLYLEAGADALFVEAPRSVEQLEQIGREFAGVPLVANIVEGGRTPQLSAAELGELGFNLILFANFLMRIMAKAGQSALSTLHETGDSRALADVMLTWAERQELVQLDLFDALESHWDSYASSDEPKKVSK